MNEEPKPVVASYCATFLKPEMLHIYRQISALRRLRPIVIAQKRENAGTFPFDPIFIVPKPAWHFLRRIWFRQIAHRPWTISSGEVRQLRQILDENAAELLHIYFGHIALLLLPLIEDWPHPVIVSFHGADVLVDLHRPAYRRLMQQMLNAVARVVVRAESLRRGVIELGCPPEKIDVQRTGIPVQEFLFRERKSPPTGEWQLLQACRLIRKKGLVTTLRAFAKFRRASPAAQLTIAGEGPMLHELQQRARELQVDNAVNFTGFVSQARLRELFYAAHMFLHPSETGSDGNQEGVPNSMLEAMATGLPVFATTHGGIPEAVQNQVSGILVAESDYESLANGLVEAAATPERLLAMGRAASQSVAENFNQQLQTERLEQIYLREIARSSPRTVR